MLVISHRGDGRRCRENTIEAFEAALEGGADGIETDLRITRDGKLVLLHDRFCGEVLVKDLSYDELCAAAGFDVTLAVEALERFRGIFWNLEIKSPPAVGPAIRLIERWLGTCDLLVTSSWHNVVEEIRERVKVACGVIVRQRPRDGVEFGSLWARGIDAVVWDYEFLDEATLARARAARLRSFAFNVETRAEHAEARAGLLDGIITDFPEYV